MSTLWANGDRGLKSTLCQQSSGQLSLTSPKKFTQSNHPLQEKIRWSQHFFTILLHSRWTNVHFMGKWRQGLKIDLVPTKQRTAIFNLAEEVYPDQSSSSRKNSPSQHFFTILLHSRWTNVHFMGKWRQGLKIDLGATKQRTVLFNLRKNVYPGQPSSSRKNSLNRHFFTFCFIPGDQMSTLWANGDRGLKSTLCQQSSGQQSLTSPKKFTQSNHPLQEKIRQVSIFSQFCFIPGETNVHFMGKWGQGLKIDLVQTKQRDRYSLTSHEEVYPVQPSTSRKNSLSRHFFHNFASL